MDLCVSSIVGLVGEHAWGPIKRHLGYLIFYKRKIKNMERKFNDELDAIREYVQRQVEEAACQRLEEVDSAVEAWLKKVDDAEEEVKRIKDTNNNNNNKGCLHFRLHHRLGRQAADHIQAIDDLVKKGKFDRVSHSPPMTGSLIVNEEGYAMFESRESCLNEILDALKDGAVHMIGVYGMPGIGKTTLVREAANKAMKDGLFTEVVVVTVSQNLDVKTIQTGIADCLRLELNEQTVQVRAGKIESRLGQNSVLVILDDLWKRLELSKVGIPDLNKGACRVVITTRSEDVCQQMGCQKKVELRTLSDEESWLLFNSRAEINVQVESPTIMMEVAWDVAKQCAGLPLPLVLLGTALKGKKLEVWNTVLNQLKESTMVVFRSIELIYNFLESEEAKLCFLHCCLYPRGYDIEEDDLMHMLVGGGLLEDVESPHQAQGRVHALMGQLKASGLLLQGWRKSCVRMHDFAVWDVAMWIGEEDHGFFVRAGQGLKEWPIISDAELQNCRRLSLMFNEIVDLPSDPINCTKLETLILCGNQELSNIPKKFFQHMKALKVLDLSFTNISCLPKSLSCLTNLRVLNLKRCDKLRDISPINGLRMSDKLILKDIKGAWIIPEDTRGLPYVSLTQENRLNRSLYLTRTKKFPPSLKDFLEEIKTLALVDCQESEIIFNKCDIPPHVFLNLEQLLVLNCLNLASFDFLIDVYNLGREKRRTLNLINMMNRGANFFDRANFFYRANSSDKSFDLMFQLKFMRVQNCLKMARLLPSKLGKSKDILPLEKLEVTVCLSMLQLFPYDLDHKPMAMTNLLPKLKILKLSDLPQLESVLQPFQCLPNLRSLRISKCGLRCGLAYHEMEMVADPFPKLKKLEINGCKEMRQMCGAKYTQAHPTGSTH